MPSPSAFASAFSLRGKHGAIGIWNVQKASIVHRTISRYHEYGFDVTLVIVPNVMPFRPFSAQDVLGYMRKKWPDAIHRRVLSDYGNPYDCTFHITRVARLRDGRYRVTGYGHATRVYDRH